MNNGWAGKAAAVLIAAGFLLSLTAGLIAEAVTALVCGDRPHPISVFSGLVLGITGDAAQYTSVCPVPIWQVRALDLLLLLLLAAATIVVWVLYRRYKNSDRAFIADLRARPGFASASEIRQHLSARALLRRARQLRPYIQKPRPTDVGW